MASKSYSFGFVGLGNMGINMAANLSTYAAEHGLPKIHVWNRTPEKAEALAKGHCQAASSLKELALSCDIVHGCLANDEVALLVYKELFAANKTDAIYVDHSTLFPPTSQALYEEAQKHGVHFLSCPVFGPPAAAKSAGLLIALSGNDDSREKIKEYIVPAIGKGVIDCGVKTSDGALLKILGNNCILGTIELLSESFTLAEKTGFDVNLFYDFIQQWFPAPAWVNYGKKIRDGSFSGRTGFTLPGGMKDADFIRRLGIETSTPTPIIDQAWSHLTTAKAIGGPGLDWSSCAAGMRVTAGLKPFKGEDFSLDRQTNEETKGANGTNGR